MSSSTWRVLKGYATYQRTPIRITSGGKCAPLKLIAMSRSLMLYRWSWREIISQMASKENLRQNCAWGSRQGAGGSQATHDCTVKTVQQAADRAVQAGRRLSTDSA